MNIWNPLAWFSAYCACTSLAFAQASDLEANPVPTSTTASQLRDDYGFLSLMSSREFVLSLFILVFGITIVLVQFFLLRSVVEKKSENIANTNLVTLIIIGTLVLISSGFTNEQIAPALGLFGTIAGYILGKSDRERKD